MTDRELMQQALDALERGRPQIIGVLVQQDQDAAIEAIRAALAQPEPEPVAWGVIQRGKGVWFVNDSRFAAQHYANHYSHRDAAGFDQKVVPLYTAPPQREWQGLTEEEMNAVYRQAFGLVDSRLVGDQIKFVSAIEAKLKEKNT